MGQNDTVSSQPASASSPNTKVLQGYGTMFQYFFQLVSNDSPKKNYELSLILSIRFSKS